MAKLAQSRKIIGTKAGTTRYYISPWRAEAAGGLYRGCRDQPPSLPGMVHLDELATPSSGGLQLGVVDTVTIARSRLWSSLEPSVARWRASAWRRREHGCTKFEVWVLLGTRESRFTHLSVEGSGLEDMSQ